jgi:hypothetical protein
VGSFERAATRLPGTLETPHIPLLFKKIPTGRLGRKQDQEKWFSSDLPELPVYEL